MLQKVVGQLGLRGQIKRLFRQSKHVVCCLEETLTDFRVPEINAEKTELPGGLDDPGNLIRVAINNLLVRDVGELGNGQARGKGWPFAQAFNGIGSSVGAERTHLVKRDESLMCNFKVVRCLGVQW